MRAHTFRSGGNLITTKTPFSISPSYSTSWFPSMPPMASSWPAAYAGIYEKQLWVYVVVSKRAKATARLPLPIYERGADDSRERRNDHPMAKLLNRPNPTMSGFDLWLWTCSTYDIHGIAFWLKRRTRGVVTELYPLHPAAMSFNDGKWTFDNGSTVIKDLADEDLVIFRTYNPTSMTYGMSPLEPLRATLENEWHARTATSSFWERGARPGMALSHPANLSEAAQLRLKAQMDSQHSGSDRTGSTIILEEGMEPKVMMLTYEEAQYIETRKLNREEVCAGYDIPPPVVHILDRATFSNITEQMRSMYRDTMAPLLRGFEATLEVDLRLREWPNDDIYAEFLMDEVLRGDFETRQEALNKADHMTIAEKRKVENLPYIEGTDRIFLNTATLPLDAIDAMADAATNPPPADPNPDEVVTPDEEARAVTRSVLGRLSWQRSLDEVDGWVLAKDLDEDHAGQVLIALHRERRANGSVASLRARLQTELTGDDHDH